MGVRRHHPAGDEAAGSSLDDSSMLCQLRVGVASLTMALQGPHPPHLNQKLRVQPSSLCLNKISHSGEILTQVKRDSAAQGARLWPPACAWQRLQRARSW